MIHMTVAESAGFCFGVQRATEAVEKALSNGDGDIFTLGHLIHNKTYNSQLEERGVRSIDVNELVHILKNMPKSRKVTVFVRAHGELKETLDLLENMKKQYPDLTVEDCTCPYVTKVRRLARDNSGDGNLFILIGKEDHPEVRGIMSCINGNGMVFPDAASLAAFTESPEAKLYCDRDISVAAQTTLKISEWKKCLKIIKKVYTNAKIFDTICNVTEIRQKEAETLAAMSDVMLVIGSRESSNTTKLFDICKSACKNSYFIENASSLTGLRLPDDCKTISVTAGASTPYSVIQEVKNTMEQMENFAELLEASMKTLNTGDIVEGVVTSISNNEIHLDLGTKTTGVIAHDKATSDPNAKLDTLFKVGDVVKAKVIKVSDIDGIATLDKTRVDADKNWVGIVDAYNKGEVLEGKITEAVKGGVVMNCNAVRVFIPASQTGIPKDGDLNSIVGQTKKIKLIEVKEERKRTYGSIRAVEREERKAKEAAFWADIAEGKEYEGTVKNMTTYGAFVDLGGVDGMVHTTELSWRHIKHPSEVVSVGDKIKVFVKSFDPEKGRISLGYKTDDTNPWTIFTNQYQVGDVANVKIVNLMPFGAFAEIVPGVDGLIHISQIADHKIANPGEILTVGETVDAKITDIDYDNKKISLSIRALMAKDEEPAEEAADAAPAVYSTDDPESLKAFDGDAE